MSIAESAATPQSSKNYEQLQLGVPIQMTQHYEAHADRVVAGFRELLGEEKADKLGDEHWSELSMMIESAISSAVLLELERAADQVGALEKALRTHAEHYD